MLLTVLAVVGCFTAVNGHGYLTIPASRTRLGFEVSIPVLGTWCIILTITSRCTDWY